MKGLWTTAASRAWLGVVAIGLVVILLVLALQLVPRLGAGQEIVDRAGPAFADERVAGTSAGVDFLSGYVDLADPLVRARGGGAGDAADLVGLISRRTGVSRERARAILRREAPHVEALTRALPLAGVSAEIPRFTAFLARTMTMSETQLGAELEGRYPALSQTLTALPAVTGGWYDMPGTEELTRFDGRTAVPSVPRLAGYLQEDVVVAMEEHGGDLQNAAGAGGVGPIPYLLLLFGLVVLAFGLVNARLSRQAPMGKIAWGIVVGIGLALVALVGVLGLSGRLQDASDFAAGAGPAFERERAAGTANAIDLLHETVRFGDPIATRKGGVSAEIPELYAFVSRGTGLSIAEVKRALRRAVPRTAALLEAVPLSSVAADERKLERYLARRLKVSRNEVRRALRGAAPRLARSLLVARDVASGWRAIPGTGELTRLDGERPVRTMPAFDAYLREDLAPLLVSQGDNVDDFAGSFPPLTALTPALAGLGLLVVLYGLAMMFLVSERRY